MKLNLKHIICPIDFSTGSQMANFYASVFAEASGARMTYVHVARPQLLDSSVEGEEAAIMNELRRTTRPMMRNIEHDYAVMYGDPAGQIVDLANSVDADLIVMGTHGRTGAERLLHGSVCEHVLRTARCGVMAVKSPLIPVQPDSGQPPPLAEGFQGT